MGRPLVLLLLLLIVVLLAAGTDAVVRRKAAGAAMQQRIFDASKFPASRPEMYRLTAEFGWKPFRGLSSARLVNQRGWTWTHLRGRQNAINMTFSHAPLRNVTATDMAFWFNNIHRNTTIQYRDGTQDTFPNYLLFHPVDHILHTRSRDNIGLNVELTWVEFPLSGCYIKSMGANGIPTFDCSEAKKGFLRNEPLKTWRDQPQGNSTTTVTAWQNVPATSRSPGRGSITFVFRVRAAIVVDAVTVIHTWSDTPAGLHIETTTIIGMLNIGGITSAGSSKNASTQAIEGYCNGEEVQASITRNILHYIQEYGNLENVIPMVKQGMGGTVVRATTARKSVRARVTPRPHVVPVPSPPVQPPNVLNVFVSPKASVGANVAPSVTYDGDLPTPVAVTSDDGGITVMPGH